MKYIFTKLSTVSDLGKKFNTAKSKEVRSLCKTGVSITVLANFSTQYLVNSIFTSLVLNGVDPNIYESSFDQWEFELNNPESETNRREADYTLLIISSTRLIQDRNICAHEFAMNLKSLLMRYKVKNSGEIILVLPESLRESFDQTSIFYRFVKKFRKELHQELENLVYFMDIDPLIMDFGFEQWHPSKFLLTGKFCCHPNCFPLYGNYLSTFILSLIKRPIRLVIVDLDNTLWNGVVGDVGFEGVDLDRESNGYHHLMLQSYLLSLKETGVLLAICSKNSLGVARSVFDNRKEMILKFDDFVAYEISWDPKSQGIRRILEQLNLTEAGVMFLDDSKFEREEVKSNIPDIMVPELPEKIENWCEYLVKTGCLTIGKVNEEDLKRSSMYYAETQRKNEAENHLDYSTFLNNLALVISPERVDRQNFDRVFELIHKTNQFNLTTPKYSLTELEKLTLREDVFCYCYRLEDKYSEYGIIAVFISEKITDGWNIITWLMSCRAMGRGVENAIFQHFITRTLSIDETVFGKYYPTDKNKPVSNLLTKIGFIDINGDDRLAFTVGKQKTPAASHIKDSSLDISEVQE